MFRRTFKKRGSGPRRFGRPQAKKMSHSDIAPHRLVQKAVPMEKMPEFVPNHKFEDFPFEPKLKSNIQKKGYLQPTPIQDESIPVVLQGRDLVGIANTGTGKTAAFLLPLLQKVMKDKTQRVLILAPTRELALQINQEFISFAAGTGIFSVSCIGGDAIGRQIGRLRQAHHFLIGTPGRIKDLYDRRALNLGAYNNVVLDEADRMLDMGFIQDITHLLSLMSKERQSLMFSATLPDQIRRLIETFLNNPVNVSVKMQETSSNIEQDVIRVPRGQNKLDILKLLLERPDFEKVLIFGRTKRGVERLGEMLYNAGFKVVSIHGDKTQGKRQYALNLFKQNRANILVATDVMARGLDIPNVSHVINFDMPANYEDYVHRIGRTGRAEKMGVALTFVEE